MKNNIRHFQLHPILEYKLTIANSIIIDALGSKKNCEHRYRGPYSDNKNVYLRFIPLNSKKYYWQAKVPFIDSGSIKITAKRYSKYKKPLKKDYPKCLHIDLVIKNHTIFEHTILDYGEIGLGLFVEKYFQENGYFYIIITAEDNNEYSWKMKIPPHKSSSGMIYVKAPQIKPKPRKC